MTFEELKKQFIEHLKSLKGSAGNKMLRGRLACSDDDYWRIHRELFDEGKITKGRGKGGSVQLVLSESDMPAEPTQVTAMPEVEREIDLYERCLKALQEGWLKERSYDESIARVTAMQGRKKTGGTWSRPDITFVGVIRAEHYPQDQVEYVTFEVKRTDDTSVMGVYEALSHQKSASHSYVMFCCTQYEFETHEQYRRIMSAASEHGIGVILLEDVNDPDSWNEWLEARRCVPSPSSVDRFISDGFAEDEKKRIRQWCRG